MIPDEIEAWRTRMGWSPHEAARALRVNSDYIRRLEKGDRVPSGTLVALMECLEFAKGASDGMD